MDRPINILFLAANPKDTSQLRLDEEMRGIDHALRQAEFRDRYDIKQQWAVRIVDLQGYLLRHKPDIVHFSGHGSTSSEIILEDNFGNSQPAPSRALGQLFSVLKDNIRCVVLNACYSEQQAQAIAKHIDCVIGMSKAIGDLAAVSFAIAFYQALGYGRDIKTAFDLGCVQIDLESLNEQDTPKLLAINSNPRDIVFVPNLLGSNNYITTSTKTAIKSSDLILQAGNDTIVKTAPHGMEHIPSGPFLMGSDDSNDSEKPVHEVYLNEFYMDKYDVTVEQYQRFLNATGYRSPEKWNEQLQFHNRPVVYVSWEDAIAYAKWLDRRLPSEAEWEYAACGGYTGIGGKPKYKYPWGNQIDYTKANYNVDGSRQWNWENAKRYLKDVDSYPPNWYGLYNMVGNVWEWCSSLYKSYPYRCEDGRENLASYDYRVQRGGSWYNDTDNLRCALRYGDAPTYQYFDIGFRCVQDVH